MRARQPGSGTSIVILVLAGSLLLVGGCASKKLVRDGMAAQSGRVDDVESQVEANQRKLRDTGRRLDDVADDARQAERLGRRASEQADAALDLAAGKLLYTVVLDDTVGTFALDSAGLAEATRDALDKLAVDLTREDASVYLEIAGYTDSTGPEAYNMSLGLRRADAVRRYLNGNHGIPLHRMSVISHGEAQPVADNGTRDGRAHNRRVEIRVLS